VLLLKFRLVDVDARQVLLEIVGKRCAMLPIEIVGMHRLNIGRHLRERRAEAKKWRGTDHGDRSEDVRSIPGLY
jgi:hypothetical protein